MNLGFTYHRPGYFPLFSKAALVRGTETGYVATTIYPLFYKQVVIEWVIPPHWGNCKFNIYRAETDAGPWRRVTNTPVIGNYYKDPVVKDFSKFMNGWYIVEVILPDGRMVQSPPATWEQKRRNWVELRAKEIERRESLLLEKFTGVRSLIFRRKQFGLRCRECWDYETEKLTKDHCKTCMGTSFDGGYFPGFETLFQYDQTPNEIAMEEPGMMESNNLHAWTISFPKIEVQDVILRVPDWKIFRVERAVYTELQTKAVRQIAQLTELSKESIEFELTKQAMPVAYTT